MSNSRGKKNRVRSCCYRYIDAYCTNVQILINPSCHPVFIHCLDGAHVTGLIIACLRKLQCWTHATIVGEALRFVNESALISEETQFLNEFDGEVVVPASVPDWLWASRPAIIHDSIRLSFAAWEMKDPTADMLNASDNSAVTGTAQEKLLNKDTTSRSVLEGGEFCA